MLWPEGSDRVCRGERSGRSFALGDFALIPAGTEHQEVNDGDDEITWIITKSGRMPEVKNLEAWGSHLGRDCIKHSIPVSLIHGNIHLAKIPYATFMSNSTLFKTAVNSSQVYCCG